MIGHSDANGASLPVPNPIGQDHTGRHNESERTRPMGKGELGCQSLDLADHPGLFN
jgi:hypothetical protein